MKTKHEYSLRKNNALSMQAPKSFNSRREALKTFALGSAVTIFSPHTLLSACHQKKERLGVALVGLGYYSTDLLAPALEQTKNCYLAGIVTGTPSKAEAWKEKYKIPDAWLMFLQIQRQSVPCRFQAWLPV